MTARQCGRISLALVTLVQVICVRYVIAQSGRVVDSSAVAASLPPIDEILDQTPEARDFAIAPDGQAIAFVKPISARTVIARFGDAPVATDRLLEPTTVWFASAPNWRPRAIIGDARHVRMLSQLRWSPDGRQLSVVETVGVRSRVLIWDRRRAMLTTASPCVLAGVDDQASANRVLTLFEWLEQDRGLLLGQPCDGDLNDGRSFVSTPLMGVEDAEAAWGVRSKGGGPAVSVLHAGLPSDSMPVPETHLWLLDASAKTVRVLTTGPYDSLVVRADGDAAVLLKAYGAQAPPPERPAPFILKPYVHGAVVIELGSSAPPVPLPIQTSAIPSTIRWSPDGQRVGLIEEDWPHGGTPCAVVYDWRARKEIARSCGPVGNGEVSDDPPDPSSNHAVGESVAWFGDGRFVVRRCGAMLNTGAATHRCDWYGVDGASENRSNLTSTLSTVPDTFWTLGPRTFAVSAGHVVEVRPPTPDDRNSWSTVLPSISDSVLRIVQVSGNPADPRFVLAVDNDTAAAWINVGASSSNQGKRSALSALMRTVGLATEGKRITIVATDPLRRTLVLMVRDSLQVEWLAVRRSSSTADDWARHSLATMREVADRRPPTRERIVAYQTTSGDSVAARVVLPIGYEAGRRYPMIVAVYPGAKVLQPVGEYATTQYSWAAYGYVELYPSQPYGYGPDHPELPINQIANGVLPAIQTVVRLGIADSTRIGVIGHSFGGYAVYALLTQTTTFRAAVAEDGWSNELLRWGVFMPYDRYSRRAEFEQGPYWYSEYGQANLPFTPWQRPDLYLENSPFFRVDKITTPVMIVQGDQDFIPIVAGEQMFNALRRLGRRVDFVRYWGEGHVNYGYWDARDLKQREVNWFTRFLGGSSTDLTKTKDTKSAAADSCRNDCPRKPDSTRSPMPAGPILPSSSH